MADLSKRICKAKQNVNAIYHGACNHILPDQSVWNWLQARNRVNKMNGQQFKVTYKNVILWNE